MPRPGLLELSALTKPPRHPDRANSLVRRMLEVSQLQSRDVMRSKAPFDVCESMRRVLISMEKKITDRVLK